MQKVVARWVIAFVTFTNTQKMNMRMTLKTIIKIGEPYGHGSWGCRQLWRDETGDYFISSSVVSPFASETMVFACDSNGEVTDWVDLGVAAPGDHEGAVRDAGFVIVGEF